MADAADSKSVALKSVRVQVPPSAREESFVNQRLQGFFCALCHNHATISKKIVNQILHPVSIVFHHRLRYIRININSQAITSQY